jgi:hypothetical protein
VSVEPIRRPYHPPAGGRFRLSVTPQQVTAVRASLAARFPRAGVTRSDALLYAENLLFFHALWGRELRTPTEV